MIAFHDRSVKAVHQPDVRVLEARDLSFQLGRQPPVVGVKECDELAVAGVDAPVPRRGRAGVVLPDVCHLCILEEGLDLRPRVVRGAVIDDDDLDARIRLVERALDGLRDESLGVVRRNDHTDQWLRGHDPLPSLPGASPRTAHSVDHEPPQTPGSQKNSTIPFALLWHSGGVLTTACGIAGAR